MRQGSAILRRYGERPRAEQKSSLGPGQYRGWKCDRGHGQEAEAGEEEGEAGEGEDGTVSLKREPTHQGMVGKNRRNIKNIKFMIWDGLGSVWGSFSGDFRSILKN